MKFNKTTFILAIATFLAIQAFGQTAQQRRNITKDYDFKALDEISNRFEETYQREKQKAFDFARQHNLPLVVEDEKGVKSFLYRMDRNGNLNYIKTSGKADAQSIGTNKLYPGGGLGLNLEGEGMKVGIWDAGPVRASHELLSGKTIQRDDGAGESPDHATHVAGIAAGKELIGGAGANARGMAYKADIDAYDWFSDFSEMTNAATEGLLVSNHSYGLDLSQVSNVNLYLGNYDEISMGADNLAYNAPYYSIVTAAGNDRNGPYNTSQNGYNLLAGWLSTAKNTIVVAAVDKILMYMGPSSVQMSNFSSWGPTNNNRVKPDISAQGVEVFSSTATSNTSYGSESGTSMASPSVAGSLLLLQELSSELNNGEFLKSATLKAIMIQTALAAEETPGPNPRFGWGLYNSEGAAQLILDNHEGVNAFYREETLNSQQETYTVNVKANGEGEVKATIAWTDRAGNDLMNDLDMRITNSQGTVFYPWRLDPANIAGPALNNGDNAVDNVEQVVVSNAAEGEEYTITVSHKGSLTSGKQDFGIAVSGIEAAPLGIENHELKGFSIYPNPASNRVNIEIEETTGKASLAIFNINGRKVMDENIGIISNSSYNLDISRLNAGVYFVKIEADGKSKTKKLIVK